MANTSRSRLRALTFIGCGISAVCASSTVARAHQPVLIPNSLIISSSTYDRCQGAVASLVVGTTLAGSATATAAAIADNDYVHVWNNETVDASFGVTSPIQLDRHRAAQRPRVRHGHRFRRIRSSPASRRSPSWACTSPATPAGRHLVFVGYAGAGVGALDVSNSDAVPGQDPTNPVTFAFGASYAFARTIVSMDARRTLLLHADDQLRRQQRPLGAARLERALLHGRQRQQRQRGDLRPERHQPRRHRDDRARGRAPRSTRASSSVAIPAGNSAEVDPLLQFTFGSRQARQAGQGQQLPRRDRVRRRALLHQGQRQQRHRDRLHRAARCRRWPMPPRRRSASSPASRPTRPRRPAATSRPSPCSSPTRRRCT